mmetsp:Transcript_38326/g.119219  ORF Transcript_38326/g.119219 Transcript_38326/m.119219 type:complete len:211 (+) Transcript_38326:744-1376(+)
MMAPYLENSALSSASLMWSGREPTKIFRAPSMPGAPPVPGTVGSMESLPNMPWCLAMVTSQGRSAPGKTRTRSQLSLQSWACSAEAKVTKAHWRFCSQPVLTKTSVICPNLENSARNAVSVMLSGSEPTKTFLGLLLAAGAAGLYMADGGTMSCGPPAGAPPSGSWPNMPWWRASVTSHGLMAPGNCSWPLVASAAAMACSAEAKVTNAH